MFCAVVEQDAALFGAIAKPFIVFSQTEFHIHPEGQLHRHVGVQYPGADPSGVFRLPVFQDPVMGIVDWRYFVQSYLRFPQDGVPGQDFCQGNGAGRQFHGLLIIGRVGKALF